MQKKIQKAKENSRNSTELFMYCYCYINMKRIDNLVLPILMFLISLTIIVIIGDFKKELSIIFGFLIILMGVILPKKF
jgi:hypothetical protein